MSSILILFPLISDGQAKEKSLSVTATGYGIRADDAKKNALRESLELSFGIFLTSTAKVVNDRLVQDEMQSVTHGNILDYQVLSEVKVREDLWAVTVRALVSVDKLVQYAESNGFKVDFKGGLFALNIYQQQLNEEGEREAVKNLVSVIDKIRRKSFEYEMVARTPISDGTSNEWKVPLEVKVKVNPNFANIPILMHSTLAHISLDEASLSEYIRTKQPVYFVNIMQQGKATISNYSTYPLRSAESVKSIEAYVSGFKKTMLSFTIDDGQSIRTIDEFEPQVDNYLTYTVKSPIKEDYFRIAAFQIYNKAIITPSLYQSEHLRIYLPELSDFVIGYVPPNMNKSEGYGYLATENGFYDDCKCFPGMLKLPGGIVLQFNNISDPSGIALKLRVYDRKSTADLKNVSRYEISTINE